MYYLVPKNCDQFMFQLSDTPGCDKEFYSFTDVDMAFVYWKEQQLIKTHDTIRKFFNKNYKCYHYIFIHIFNKVTRKVIQYLITDDTIKKILERFKKGIKFLRILSNEFELEIYYYSSKKEHYTDKKHFELDLYYTFKTANILYNF